MQSIELEDEEGDDFQLSVKSPDKSIGAGFVVNTFFFLAIFGAIQTGASYLLWQINTKIQAGGEIVGLIKSVQSFLASAQKYLGWLGPLQEGVKCILEKMRFTENIEYIKEKSQVLDHKIQPYVKQSVCILKIKAAEAKDAQERIMPHIEPTLRYLTNKANLCKDQCKDLVIHIKQAPFLKNWPKLNINGGFTNDSSDFLCEELSQTDYCVKNIGEI